MFEAPHTSLIDLEIRWQRHARVRPAKVVDPSPGLAGRVPCARGRVLCNGVELRVFPVLGFRLGDEMRVEISDVAGFGAPHRRQRSSVERDQSLGEVQDLDLPREVQP